MSPTGIKNTASKDKNQAAEDIRLAYEHEANILNRMRMAIAYANLANDHAEIYDSFGFDRSVSEFVAHAKEINSLLAKLRKVRGVLD